MFGILITMLGWMARCQYNVTDSIEITETMESSFATNTIKPHRSLSKVIFVFLESSPFYVHILY